MLALFLPLGILLTAGLVVLSSVSMHLFWLQLLWVGIGIAVVFVFLFVDWHFILNYRWLIGAVYLLAVFLLILVYLKGPIIRNAKSWLVWGPFGFQPVELAKIALILLYANYFSRRHLSIAHWQNILTSFILFLVPAFLVTIQPNLGSALVLFGVWFGFLLFSGLPPRRVAAVFLFLAVAGFFLWTNVLRDYQRDRIMGFFYPEENTLSINYNVVQSKIAIGSAGLLGRGYHQGPQTQLGFLPEPGSDFILAALVEEWGVLGGLAVLGSFLFLIFQVLKVGTNSDGNFEKFFCIGTVMVWGLQFIFNAGSATGLTPVVGITFPFLSYGGSSLIAGFFLISIINAIRRSQ